MIDALFVVRIVQNEHKDYQRKLYRCFADTVKSIKSYKKDNGVEDEKSNCQSNCKKIINLD